MSETTNDPQVKQKQAPEELTIEELAAKNNVPAWVMAGLKTANNWGAGKQISEKEFLAKKDAWLKGPMCR